MASQAATSMPGAFNAKKNANVRTPVISKCRFVCVDSGNHILWRMDEDVFSIEGIRSIKEFLLSFGSNTDPAQDGAIVGLREQRKFDANLLSHTGV